MNANVENYERGIDFTQADFRTFRKHVMNWSSEGKSGAKILRSLAAQIKERGCTDGLWSPDLKLRYDATLEAIGWAELR